MNCLAPKKYQKHLKHSIKLTSVLSISLSLSTCSQMLGEQKSLLRQMGYSEIEFEDADQYNCHLSKMTAVAYAAKSITGQAVRGVICLPIDHDPFPDL